MNANEIIGDHVDIADLSILGAEPRKSGGSWRLLPPPPPVCVHTQFSLEITASHQPWVFLWSGAEPWKWVGRPPDYSKENKMLQARQGSPKTTHTRLGPTRPTFSLANTATNTTSLDTD